MKDRSHRGKEERKEGKIPAAQVPSKGTEETPGFESASLSIARGRKDGGKEEGVHVCVIL